MTGRRIRPVAAMLVTVAVAATMGAARATDTGGVRSVSGAAARGTVAEAFKVKTKGPTVVYSSRVHIDPGAHTAWHTHPGPHIVVVKSVDPTAAPTLRIYGEGCTSYTDYPAGTGFVIDEPKFVHAARNIGTATIEIAVTDIREGDRPPTITLNPQPSHSCLKTELP